MAGGAALLRTTDPARVAIVVAVAVLAARNVAGWLYLPDGAYVPVNLALAAGMVALAWWAGISSRELGLDPRRVGAGLRYGVAVLGLVVVALAVAAAIPAAHTFFEDDRARVSGVGMAFHTLVRIPLGTVVLEELAFRGVLLALFLRLLAPVGAVAASSVLFGLWHLLPSLNLGSNNDGLTGIDGALGVVGIAGVAVVVTALAGAVFCWLRLRSDSLVAPVVAHISTNSVAFFVAWLLM